VTGTDRLSSHISTPTVDFYLSADQFSQSIANNTSVVRCYIRAVNRGNTSTFYAQHNAAVTFTVAGQGPYGATGTNADFTSGHANGATFWEYGPYDVTVAHNADGTGSAALTFHVSYPNATSGGGDYATTLPLTTIPRATTPTTSSGTVAIGGSITIDVAPASSGFNHRIWYAFGTLGNKNAGLSGGGGSASGTDGTDGYWSTGTGNRTVTFAVPVNLAKQMTGLAAQTLTVFVDTYNSGTKIGSTKTATVTVTPANSVVYNLPSVDASVFRSLSNGTPSDSGVCATLVVTAAVTSINTGSEQNTLSYLWEVSTDGVTWKTLASATAGGLTLTSQSYTYTDSDPGTGGTQTFATTSSYQFRLTVTDALSSSATRTLTMSTAAAIIDIYDEPGQPVGFAIGALYDTAVGGLQINGNRRDVPPGNVSWTVRSTAPSGWLLADGSAVSRTTYADLFSVCNEQVGTATVTIASPGVWTRTSHGLFTGQRVYLTTTGALPTGLSGNTDYWVIRVDANTFRLATSLANAQAGTAINTSGSQSGTHTVTRTYGVGNGSTTFNLPDIKGKSPISLDTGQTEFDALGETGGEKTHTLVTAEIPSHSHLQRYATSSTGGSGGFDSGVNATGSGGRTSNQPTDVTGGGGAHNNLQPYIVLNAIIKT